MITNAIPLAQTGMLIPFTVTSQLNMKRSNLSRAISEKKTTDRVVKGFKCGLRCVDEG